MKKEKKHMKRNRFICLLSAVFMMVILTAVPALADGTRVVTLGVDLTDAQEQFIINYFGVDLSTAKVIYVNNQQEREYVGSWIPIEQIGDQTISSAYVQPTNSGGIQVKTANLTYVTGNMLASVLSTAGVKNCNIVAAAPFEVSGTGALTGVMIAYQEATGQPLDESRRDLAVQEFTVTQQTSGSIGEQEALQLVNAVKMEVIQSGVPADDTAQIQQIVDQVVTEMDQSLTVNGNVDSVSMDQTYNVDNSTNIDNSVSNVDNSVTTINNGLTAEDRQMIVDLATEIAKQQYQYEDMKETLQRVEDNLSDQTNISISIDNSNDNSNDSSSETTIENDNSADASADASSEENILDTTNDGLVEPGSLSGTRTEDIENIEEAVKSGMTAEPSDAPQDSQYVMNESYSSFDNDTQTDAGQTPQEPLPAPEDTTDAQEPVIPEETQAPEESVIAQETTVSEIPEDTQEQTDVPQETEEEESTAESYDVVEGSTDWTVKADSSAAVTSEEMDNVWANVSPYYDDMNLTALACLGSQVVAGANYQFLCTGEPMEEAAEAALYVAVVYQDTEGNTIISSLSPFDLDELEQSGETSAPDQNLMGGWSSPSDVEAGDAMEGYAASAFGAMMTERAERNILPVMLLSTKPQDGGTEYAVLCYETSGEGTDGYYEVAFIHTDEAGNYLYSNLVLLDLADYNS